MSIQQRMAEVFETAEVIDFDDDDKFIFMSDCHRGDNSWSDSFADNQLLFYHALKYYLNRDFTYIEIGDGDELWENKDYAEIMDAHSYIFELLNCFLQEHRLYILFGNHDIERLDHTMMKKANQKFQTKLIEQRGARAWNPEFDKMEFPEALKLRHTATGQMVFLVHGHQFDHFNDRWWRIGRLFNNYFWKHLQIIGLKDPASPAKNAIKMNKVDRRIEDWLRKWNEVNEPMLLVAGHTHHPRFPEKGTVSYFNTGSGVHPRGITGIEIQNGEITLVKWWTTVRVLDKDEGVLTVSKEIIRGPESLKSFYCKE